MRSKKKNLLDFSCPWLNLLNARTKARGDPNMKKSVTSNSNLPNSDWLPVLVLLEPGHEACLAGGGLECV